MGCKKHLSLCSQNRLKFDANLLGQDLNCYRRMVVFGLIVKAADLVKIINVAEHGKQFSVDSNGQIFT